MPQRVISRISALPVKRMEKSRRGKEKKESPPPPPPRLPHGRPESAGTNNKTSELLYVLEPTGFSNIRMILKDYLLN